MVKSYGSGGLQDINYMLMHYYCNDEYLYKICVPFKSLSNKQYIKCLERCQLNNLDLYLFVKFKISENYWPRKSYFLFFPTHLTSGKCN